MKCLLGVLHHGAALPGDSRLHVWPRRYAWVATINAATVLCALPGSCLAPKWLVKL